ncbi:hypothetical protein, partial [Rahnella aquatilis]|uniref:hypothetical protein n=1 Tax=Rahnella aquatilis TaxID=34038 RepID=UPI001E3385B2
FFLSCLYGSELFEALTVECEFFLSCLYGSEQLRFQLYALNCKRLSLFGKKYPLFLRALAVNRNQWVSGGAKKRVSSEMPLIPHPNPPLRRGGS